MFITNRKIKKLKTELYIVAATGTITGITGTTLGTIALVSCSREKKKTEERFVNIEKHLSAVETATTKCCKELIPVQQTLLDNGFIMKK